MIVVFSREATPEQVEAVAAKVRELGATALAVHAEERSALHVEAIPDQQTREALKRVRSMSGVEQVLALAKGFERLRPGSVDAGGVVFGGEELVLMAGPCTVESEEQLFAAAEAVAKAGAKVLRGGAYKPTTSPYSFPGLGLAALKMLQEAGCRFGLKVVTEVMDPRKVEIVAEHAEILQIGARNMQNFDLLREAGRSGRVVLLKRGMSARIEEWLLAAEHVAAGGGERIVLCERGIRTFETATRNTLDLAAVPVAKGLCGLPVVVDPSHGTGRRDLIGPMSLAAVACGADGLLIEVHPNPEEALKDGAQSLSVSEFAALVPDISRVASALGRSVALPAGKV